MNECTICRQPTVSDERLEIGKTHCTDKDCIAEWRRRQIETKGLALVFVHKQGMQWIKKSDVPKNDMKRAGGL